MNWDPPDQCTTRKNHLVDRRGPDSDAAEQTRTVLPTAGLDSGHTVRKPLPRRSLEMFTHSYRNVCLTPDRPPSSRVFYVLRPAHTIDTSRRTGRARRRRKTKRKNLSAHTVASTFRIIYSVHTLTGVYAPFAKQTLGREPFGAAQLSDDEKLSHDETTTTTTT